jgi:amidohydrolase
MAAKQKDELKEMIRKAAKDLHEEVVGWRHHLHRYPELSNRETATAAYIAERLNKAGIEVQKGVGGTGVVGMIKASDPDGKVIAIRADMDALPIKEQNDITYKSENEGVMHACGHDVHMAVLLGAARIINDMKDNFKGQVKLIFQPSEETYPGGAQAMIKDGVLENPVPDIILGEHVYPELDSGKIGLKAGKYMASTDEIFITVHGKGGHGAIPDRNIDPVVIAANIIIALQQIVSRSAKPSIPSVLSIGRVIADGRTNIIPDKVEMEGIIRTFDENWRLEMREKIRKIASSVAEGLGGSCEVTINPGYPYLENDKKVTEKVEELAQAYLGHENVVELEPRMTAEDFAYYLHHIPGCFYRLGVRNETSGVTSSLHTATFNVDESSIETGMGLMAWMVISQLKE